MTGSQYGLARGAFAGKSVFKFRILDRGQELSEGFLFGDNYWNLKVKESFKMKHGRLAIRPCHQREALLTNGTESKAGPPESRHRDFLLRMKVKTSDSAHLDQSLSLSVCFISLSFFITISRIHQCSFNIFARFS